jgi:sugar O-acyltransferase (sialic acid O-acetyltransferase NeuD family)
MMERTIIRLPQVSANETGALLLEWFKQAGEEVRAGEIVCAVETTKSVFDVEAESAGILFPLVAGGETAEVGQPIAVLSSSRADDAQGVRAWLQELERGAQGAAGTSSPGGTHGAAPGPVAGTEAGTEAGGPPAAKSATLKAELLARRHAVDLAGIPASGERITEADVRAYLDAAAAASMPGGATPEEAPAGCETRPASAHPAAPHAASSDAPPAAVQRLLILGGGDGAVQVLDAAFANGVQCGAGILDDNPALQGKRILGVPVLGPISAAFAEDLYRRKEFDAAIISISTIIPLRRRLFEEFGALGIPFANVIHPAAFVGSAVELGRGNVILAFCHVGACAAVGDNNFLSAYVSIEHHGRLGNHCSFGPAVVTSSRVEIGDGSRFGTGIFIEPKIRIGAASVIGSGSILRGDLPPGSVVKTRLAQALRRKRTGD